MGPIPTHRLPGTPLGLDPPQTTPSRSRMRRTVRHGMLSPRLADAAAARPTFPRCPLRLQERPKSRHRLMSVSGPPADILIALHCKHLILIKGHRRFAISNTILHL